MPEEPGAPLGREGDAPNGPRPSRGRSMLTYRGLVLDVVALAP